MSFSSTSNNPSIELFALFEKDFQWEITDNPEFATQAGTLYLIEILILSVNLLL